MSKLAIFGGAGALAAAGVMTAMATGMIEMDLPFGLDLGPLQDGAVQDAALVQPQAAPEPDPVGAASDPVAGPTTKADLAGSVPAPRFDLVRSEADGQTLVAGSALPRADVTVLVDGAPGVSGPAGGDGRFVFFLDLPPSTQGRVLTLRMTHEGGELLSQEDVILAPALIAMAAPEKVPEKTPENTPEEVAATPSGDSQLVAMATLDAPKPDPEPDKQAAPEAMPSAAPLPDTSPQDETPGDDMQATTEPPATDTPDVDPAKAKETASAAPAPQQSAPVVEKLDPKEAPGQQNALPSQSAAAPGPFVDETTQPPAQASAEPSPETTETPERATASNETPAPQTQTQTQPESSQIAQAPEPKAPAASDPTPGDTAQTRAPQISSTLDVARSGVEPRQPEPPRSEPLSAPQISAAQGPALPAPSALPQPSEDRQTAALSDQAVTRPAPAPPRHAAPALPQLAAPPVISVAPTASGDAPGRPMPPAQADPPSAPVPAVLRSTPQGVEALSTAPLAPGEVALDSISYDAAGEVLLAGRGEDQAFVRIYLDNAPLTTTAVEADGSWRVELPQVDTGTYTLRVDQIDAGGQVVARVESPFLRESPETLAEARGDGPITAITVQPGNTLWAIARDRYGEGLAYVRVFEANRDRIRNPDLIYPGQIFDLPDSAGVD